MGPVIDIDIQIGIDIGQQRDPTAIAVCEALPRTSSRELTYLTRYLERLPLGTPYPKIASRLAEIVRNVHIKAHQDRWQEGTSAISVETFVDATGVGQPVVDVLAEAGVRVTACYFTHGDRRTIDGERVTIGKAWLVSRLQALLQTDRLHLPAEHPEAPALLKELLDYEIKVSEDANDRYGAFRTGAHDDLVTALGLAVQADPRAMDIRPASGVLADYLDGQGYGW